MHRVTITLSLLVPDKSDEGEVQRTMLDAFSEFAHPRYYPAEYVNKRYPPNELTRAGEPAYSWLDREEKIAEVTRRKDIALALKGACFEDGAIEVGETFCEACDECGGLCYLHRPSEEFSPLAGEPQMNVRNLGCLENMFDDLPKKEG